MSLPTTTDDVLDSLGLMRKQPIASDWVTPVALFGVGLVTGAATALLLAPKSGREIREDLRTAAANTSATVANQLPALPAMPSIPSLGSSSTSEPSDERVAHHSTLHAK